MNNKLLIIWLSFLGGAMYTSLLWAAILFQAIPYVAGAILGGVGLIALLGVSFAEGFKNI